MKKLSITKTMDDNKELLHDKGRIYGVIGWEDGETWTYVDFPKITYAMSDWKKIWNSLKEVLGDDLRPWHIKSTKIKIRTTRMLAFDRKIYHYKAWFERGNYYYSGEEYNSKVDLKNINERVGKLKPREQLPML